MVLMSILEKLFYTFGMGSLCLLYISVLLSLPDLFRLKDYRKITMMLVFPLIVFWSITDIEKKRKKNIVLVLSLAGCVFSITALILFYIF